MNIKLHTRIKIRHILLFLFMLLAFSSFSQDLITKKNGEDIKAKIIEIGVNEVKFKRADNLDGPLITILKEDILIIRYENGQKEIFETKSNENSNLGLTNNNINLPFQGEQDAVRYYKGYRGHKLGTFLPCIFIGPLFGLIPAGANSHAELKEKHLLNNNQPELFKNPQYYDAYTHQAKKIKRKKVWGGYLGGSLIFVGIVGILSFGL